MMHPDHRLETILAGEASAAAILIALTLFTPAAARPVAGPVAGPVAAPVATAQARIVSAGRSAARTAAAKPASGAAAPSARPVQAEAPPPASVSPASITSARPGEIPDTGPDYRKARRVLLAKGFRPTHVAPPECWGPEPSVDACWGALVEFPEIESCQGQNGATCVGWWVAADGRVLKIRTGGEHARITDRHWASPGEIDELPSGWRP